MTTNDGTVGRYLGWFLVALSLGAGVIHFAVAGGHFDVSWYHGIFFAVVAWLQLVWAAAIIVRPTRQLLVLGALGNTVVIVTWFVSRVWGMPIGPDAGEPEPVSLADALATGLEVGIVALSLAVLLRPALAQRSVGPRLGLVALGTSGITIAVVSTVALSPSFADDHHGHGASDSHASVEAAAAHEHADAAASDAASDAAAAAASGHPHADSDYMIMADGTSACETSGIANEGNSGGSGHGHRGPVPFAPMDAAIRAEYQTQVAEATAAAARYPTVADAEAAGYHRITPYVPCIAAHYIKQTALMSPFDPAEPEILLYDGTDPNSQIVGLSYLVLGNPDQPPEGFAGENDPWHVHSQLCIGAGGVVGDESTTEQQCADRGGRLIQLGDLWMTHMWPVAGWDSRWGLFSSEHPDLGGTIGNING